MDVDTPVQTALPDLNLADRRFLLTVPEVDNKAELLQDIKNAILKDSTLLGEKRQWRTKRVYFLFMYERLHHKAIFWRERCLICL